MIGFCLLLADGGVDEATVLVVDDEESVADMYVSILEEDYDVRVAYGGEEALEKVDDDVDVVLLDRHMPEMSGDEVLEHIRREGLDCSVSMVTAVDADFDILEMDFDHYITKPVKPHELRETVNYLLVLGALDERLREYQSLHGKAYMLQGDAGSDEEFEGVKERMQELEGEIDELMEEIDQD